MNITFKQLIQYIIFDYNATLNLNNQSKNYCTNPI
jgi:hypothetical protein